jgi:hypothetical protein
MRASGKLPKDLRNGHLVGHLHQSWPFPGQLDFHLKFWQISRFSELVKGMSDPVDPQGTPVLCMAVILGQCKDRGHG